MGGTDNLEILGDLAEKIKNNVKEQVDRFSWKLKFPKEVLVEAIAEENIMILNKNLQRMRSEFVIHKKENSILISPQAPYKPNQEYFFWAKYNKKEICIAFMVNDKHQMRTFDRKTSMDKMNASHRREASKLAKAAELNQATAQKEAPKPPPEVDE